MKEQNKHSIREQGKQRKRETSEHKVLPFTRSDSKNPIKVSTTRKCILVVDDEEHILNLLRINLDDQNYDIVEASNGKEAIAMAHKYHPRLILLDLMMPELDGLAVCRALKEDPSTSNISIIILTAMGETARKQSVECGADHFITKPFSPLRLLAELQQFLEGSTC